MSYGEVVQVQESLNKIIKLLLEECLVHEIELALSHMSINIHILDDFSHKNVC